MARDISRADGALRRGRAPGGEEAQPAEAFWAGEALNVGVWTLGQPPRLGRASLPEPEFANTFARYGYL